jgi:hypothetical protein
MLLLELHNTMKYRQNEDMAKSCCLFLGIVAHMMPD